MPGERAKAIESDGAVLVERGHDGGQDLAQHRPILLLRSRTPPQLLKRLSAGRRRQSLLHALLEVGPHRPLLRDAVALEAADVDADGNLACGVDPEATDEPVARLELLEHVEVHVRVLRTVELDPRQELVQASVVKPGVTHVVVRQQLGNVREVALYPDLLAVAVEDLRLAHITASRPTVKPGGRSPRRSSASSTPGTYASRERASWRIVSSWPDAPRRTSW